MLWLEESDTAWDLGQLAKYFDARSKQAWLPQTLENLSSNSCLLSRFLQHLHLDEGLVSSLLSNAFFLNKGRKKKCNEIMKHKHIW